MRAIAFVDHEIGYRLLEKMLGPELQGKIVLAAAVTSKANGTAWWPGVDELARKHRLPLLRYPEESDRLVEFGPVDFHLLLSWKYLLPPAVLALPAIGTLNLHYSLLPKYRGVYPVNWAIIKGEAETGVTFHWVGPAIDSGPVICQRSLPIRAEDTARSLQLRLDDLAFALFDELVGLLGRITPPPQVVTPGLPPSAYYSRDKFASTDEIDLEKTYRARDLINLLRGKTFLPGGKHAYFLDPKTGAKVFLHLNLRKEE